MARKPTTRKTKAKPKATGTLPRPGTKAHAFYKLLRRRKGVTVAETTALYGYASGIWGSVVQLARRTGYAPYRAREGSTWRYWLATDAEMAKLRKRPRAKAA